MLCAQILHSSVHKSCTSSSWRAQGLICRDASRRAPGHARILWVQSCIHGSCMHGSYTEMLRAQTFVHKSCTCKSCVHGSCMPRSYMHRSCMHKPLLWRCCVLHDPARTHPACTALACKNFSCTPFACGGAEGWSRVQREGELGTGNFSLSIFRGKKLLPSSCPGCIPSSIREKAAGSRMRQQGRAQRPWLARVAVFSLLGRWAVLLRFARPAALGP